MKPFNIIIPILFLLSLCGMPVSAQSDADTMPQNEGSFFSKHIELEVQFSNVYETNIDHDLEPLPSYGMVPALQARFQNRPDNAWLTLDYVVARHAYTNTDRWDRVSNFFRAAIEPNIGDRFHMTTAGEVSLKGSSEDRDVSNQYQVLQEFEYRITNRHRLQLYGTYRLKRFPDIPNQNTFKPNVGLNFQRTNSDGERFETGARYEINKGQESRQGYKRWTFAVEYRTPELGKNTQFEFEVKHRRKFYSDRFIEIDDEDYLRQDNRFSISAGWIYEVSRDVAFQLEYEYETRGSNDPEKLYEANVFSLQVIYGL